MSQGLPRNLCVTRMRLRSILTIAFRNLRRTPLRSGLTALGVVIGVAAVIAMVSIGSGARARVEQALARLDLSTLNLIARPPADALGRSTQMAAGMGLTVDDYYAILHEIRGAVAVSPEVLVLSGTTQANGRGREAMLSGIDVSGFEFISRQLVEGAPFGANEVAGSASVCLITRFLADMLFVGNSPVGRRIRLNGIPFLVIGIVSNVDSSSKIDDATVFVPFTSLLRRIDRNAEISLSLKAIAPERVEALRSELRDLMEQRRGRRTAEFKAMTSEELLQIRTDNARTMTLLLGAIAGISLLVGGIGIMNIMLVNVTERTREIGIRMAVGTHSSDMLLQFLLEAAALSILGGAIGILAGTGIAQIIAHFNGWPIRVPVLAVMGAFLCSACIGIFFGYYPARRAASLDPIAALRTE